MNYAFLAEFHASFAQNLQLISYLLINYCAWKWSLNGASILIICKMRKIKNSLDFPNNFKLPEMWRADFASIAEPFRTNYVKCPIEIGLYSDSIGRYRVAKFICLAQRINTLGKSTWNNICLSLVWVSLCTYLRLKLYTHISLRFATNSWVLNSVLQCLTVP